MRIIAGRFKGRRLRPVGSEVVRSTADRVKESLFNILMHDTPNAIVLDLFCGAGTLGLEALSRGAEHVVFVDSAPKSLTCTIENARSLGVESDIQIHRADVLTALRTLAKKRHDFTLVLADPPYNEGWPPRVLDALATWNGRAAEGVVVIEHHKKENPGEPPDGFSLWTTRRFGDTMLTFWRWSKGDD